MFPNYSGGGSVFTREHRLQARVKSADQTVQMFPHPRDGILEFAGFLLVG